MKAKLLTEWGGIPKGTIVKCRRKKGETFFSIRAQGFPTYYIEQAEADNYLKIE